MKTEELKKRWIDILRQKATYEHDKRKRGEVVCSPSIDDICNEMEAFFTGLNNNYTQRRLEVEEIEKAHPEAYKWAREFHNLYEHKAPFFGYETKKETREFDPTSQNGRLMAYVCMEIIHQAVAEETARVRARIREAWNYPCNCDRKNFECIHDFSQMRVALSFLKSSEKAEEINPKE